MELIKEICSVRTAGEDYQHQDICYALNRIILGLNYIIPKIESMDNRIKLLEGEEVDGE